MKVVSKTIKMLVLSREEIDSLVTMVEEARKGTTVNYSERRLSNGQYFGISVKEVEDHSMPRPSNNIKNKY